MLKRLYSGRKKKEKNRTQNLAGGVALLLHVCFLLVSYLHTQCDTALQPVHSFIHTFYLSPALVAPLAPPGLDPATAAGPGIPTPGVRVHERPVDLPQRRKEKERERVETRVRWTDRSMRIDFGRGT